MSRARVKVEDRRKAPTYFRKALRFAAAARDNATAGHDDPAVANAVNAVINLVDALCVHYTGQRNGGEAHHDALALLRSVTDIEAPTRAQLERHLGALLSVKSLAQYEGRLVSADEVESALAHMERAMRSARDLTPVRAWEGSA